MKKFLTILLLFYSFAISAQKPLGSPIGTKTNRIKVLGEFAIDSALVLPKDTIKLQSGDRALAWKTSRWWQWTGTHWDTLISGIPKASADLLYQPIGNYMTANSPITPGTHTKITYGANGLVISASDATTSDVPEGVNLYFTNARARASLSSGGTGGSYNPTTGLITFNGVASLTKNGSRDSIILTLADNTRFAVNDSINSFWTNSGNNVYNTNSGNIGIGTSSPAASAILEVTSTTKGVLFPRLTTAQMNAVASPATGLLIFNTDSLSYHQYTGTTWQNLRGGAGGGGGGSVTDFSAGDITGLFTTTEATTTTTPSLSFNLTTQAANSVFAGPTSGGVGTPSFRALVTADIPNLSTIYEPADGDLSAIAALGGTSGYLKKTGVNIWTLDNSTFLTQGNATTVGYNIFTLPNPSVVSFIRMNADNTVSSRSPSNVKIDLGLNLVENTAISTWAGSSNVTTVGNLTSGSIGVGFTPIPNSALSNSAIIINGTSVSLGGTRTLSLASADFVNQGTTTTVLHGNAAGNPSFAQIVNADIAASTIDLTAKVTGILPATNGGTGVNNATRTLTLLSNAGTINFASPSTTLTLAANATLSGTNTGDQTTITGNAGSATILQTARTINGVAFDGSANIVVPAAAGTLTGSILNSTVVTSSLTTVGALTSGSLASGFTIVSPALGGTGVNNGSRTLTIGTNGGSLIFSSALKTLTVADDASISGDNTGDQDLTSLAPYTYVDAAIAASEAANTFYIDSTLISAPDRNVFNTVSANRIKFKAFRAGTNMTITPVGDSILSFSSSSGSSYTFSTGLTNTSGTITANLVTGLAGGQTVIGGTASGEGLTLSSTSNATKGTITLGSSLVYTETTNFFGGAANIAATAQLVAGSAPSTNITYRILNGSTSFTSNLWIGTNATTAGNKSFIIDGTQSRAGFVEGNASGRLLMAGISYNTGDNTAGSEDADFVINTMQAGVYAPRLTITNLGGVLLNATNTATGTTGNRTINKPSGTVNIAAGGSSVTVTNSLVTTSSIVIAVVRTNDATALVKNVVPGTGSFVITMNANVTAETSIGFLVIN